MSCVLGTTSASSGIAENDAWRRRQASAPTPPFSLTTGFSHNVQIERSHPARRQAEVHLSKTKSRTFEAKPLSLSSALIILTTRLISTLSNSCSLKMDKRPFNVCWFESK
jgi:hypothetical protein